MDFNQPTSTPPKLSLFSLPSKPPSLPDGLTPPPNAVAAIPFLWEEAPGKPRPTASGDPPKSKTVRSLDLPPRLAALSPTSNGNNHCDDKLGKNSGMEIIPSPTTVLGGPYGGCNIESSSWSSEKAVVGGDSGKSKGKMRMPLRKLMRKEISPVKIRSWRWYRGSMDIIEDSEGDRSPSVTLCSWRWDSFRDGGGGGSGDGDGGGGGSLDSGGKMEKVARKNSFSFNNGSTSGFLGHMYGSLKQAMPWRSRR